MEDRRIDMLERQMEELMALIHEEVRRQTSEQIARLPPPSTLPGPNSMMPREEAWSRLVACCQGVYTQEELVGFEDATTLRTVAASMGLDTKADQAKVEAQWGWLRQQRRNSAVGFVPHDRPFRVEPLHGSPKLAKSKVLLRPANSRTCNPSDSPSATLTPRKAHLLRPTDPVHCDPNGVAARTPTPRALRKAVASPTTKEWNPPKTRVRGEYVPPEPHPVGVRMAGGSHAETWLY